jgi:hypothetical protein
MSPKGDIYTEVVLLMMMVIGHTISAVNDLKVCAADSGNEFLYGKMK